MVVVLSVGRTRATAHGDTTSWMVGRGDRRSGVLRLPAGTPVDMTGDPHVTVVTVAVVSAAGVADVAGIVGGVTSRGNPTGLPHKRHGVPGVPCGGGVVPRCRGDVLAGPWAPPEPRDVSAASKVRTAVPAGVVIAGRAPRVFFADVVVPRGPRGASLADGRARDASRASTSLFSTGTLDARARLLVNGPALLVVVVSGGVRSGVLLHVPPRPPKDGESSPSGDGRGGARAGLDAPLFSRGTLTDLRFRLLILLTLLLTIIAAPAELVDGGDAEGGLLLRTPPLDDV